MAVIQLVLVTLKDAPVHRVHMEAYRRAFLRRNDVAGVTWLVSDEYEGTVGGTDRVVTLGPGRKYGEIVRRLPEQLRRIRTLQRKDVLAAGPADAAHVFVQTTHPSHWALMLHLRRILPGPSIRYYLHEPTTWLTKVRKGDGLLHATSVYLTQCVDMFIPDIVYVSRIEAVENLGRRVYPAPGLKDRTRVLPLPFLDMAPDLAPGALAPDVPRTVLFLGRADERRCMALFFASARESHRRGDGWRWAMLSGSSPQIPSWAKDLPNLDMRVGRPYTEDEMAAELRRAGYVFNLYNVQYTQSGVSPMALMFGVPLIANVQERHEALERAGCLYFDEQPTAPRLLELLAERRTADRAAIRRHYLATHDATSLVIP